MIKKVEEEALTTARYALLYETSPSKEMVAGHITCGICFDYQTERLQGILVLLPTHPRTLGIVDIAASEESRGRGIGQELLHFTIDFTKKEKYDSLEIGTKNTGFQQLYLCQKVGFRMIHIEPDLFVHHYDEPIIGNSLPLGDMVRLRLHLSWKEVGTEPFGSKK